jgi:amino acid transporter
MTDRTATAASESVPASISRLEPNAVSVAQDVLIGMADTGPTVTMLYVLVALIAASAYAGPLIILITAVPMLIIANAYRRLNLWNANCGASFEWVGRAMDPYLGYLTGWLMLAGTLFGSLVPVIALGPSVLAVFKAPTTSVWPNIGIATGLVLVMLVISVVGIKITARTQVAIGVMEYLILSAFAVWGLIWVLSHHVGTVHITAAWFSLHGVGGRGGLIAGFLITVFMFSGWDGTLYVNEEVKHRRANPGKAAMVAVLIAAVLFILAQTGLQGVASYKTLNANSSSVLVYLGTTLSGSGVGGQVMAFALALCVIAATGVGIVLSARIAYGMASYRALPNALANVSPRFSTPAIASVVAGVLLIAMAWVNLLTTSVANAFNYVLDNTGILYAAFYCITALAAIVYYRRRALSNWREALTIGILPLASVIFLGWVSVKSMFTAPAAQNYSLLGFLVVGVVLLLIARFVWRSPFFNVKRESWTPGED